jgi:hypothetical protein
MDMFGKPRIDMTLIQTTSKEAIKRSALYACGGDVKAAEGVLSQLKESFENVTTKLMCLSPSMLTHGGPGCVLVQAIRK